MIPWGLYDLTPRDQGSPNIRPYNVTSTAQGGAGTNSNQHVYTVPDDYVLLISAISIFAQTLNQNVKQHENRIYDRTGALTKALMVATSSQVLYTLDFGYTWTGSPLLMLNPGDQVRCMTTLVANDAAVWTHWSSIQGIMVPRGTISLT